MDQAMDGKDKHILEFIGAYAVLLAFCIKKAKNNNATPQHKTNDTKETKSNTTQNDR